MSEKLFEDFRNISGKEWKQKIQVDLKGANYESLIFHSNEGIDVKPFYHQDNFKPSYAPTSPARWNITERFIISEKTTSVSLLESLEKGTEALWLVITSDEINLPKLLTEIDIEKIPVFLDFQFLSKKILQQLKEIVLGKNHQLSVGVDIVGNLSATGNWFYNQKEDFQLLTEFIQLNDDLPITISVNTSIYQNAGANIVQQLAYAMAHVNEYLNYLNEHFPQQLKEFRPTFKVSTGSNYFFEIAKLKALRQLYASLAEAYKAPETIQILAFPTQRNKTIYDYNVNMLRTTTESMSSILGGANWVCNLPYDEIYHHDNDFGRRIARNQLLILKEESYFDKVANASDGSYYVEEITSQLAEKALEIFKSIEKSGGWITSLMEGTIQRKIKESADKELAQFNEAEKTLVGTNKYLNPEDKMKADLEKSPFLQKKERKTLLKPIIQKRLAEKSEQIRLETE
ncbi:methylmalonyl-CoA mutase subunit beta [Mesonia aestuariivivens]|uniref:Methylmalonyl-CoA mutase subunit beta n=1 Tax=Mesonia aestuariivivens TaxID=2796128 RepID=A0ABS6W1Y1_9FLAO|nr:methylmalonyl-CoA mutase subunit beta [Mesonia aestuariivivens]MBW2961139.1 methylmalonyl-CoA mutase subunit beta [Mesonia aestuariivivens]